MLSRPLISPVCGALKYLSVDGQQHVKQAPDIANIGGPQAPELQLQVSSKVMESQVPVSEHKLLGNWCWMFGAAELWHQKLQSRYPQTSKILQQVLRSSRLPLLTSFP